MALNHEHGRSDAAAKVARKLLRLNPGDNLGVRYLLPFVLLEKAELAAVALPEGSGRRGRPDRRRCTGVRRLRERRAGNLPT